jgi:hypothetical protein
MSDVDMTPVIREKAVEEVKNEIGRNLNDMNGRKPFISD